MADRFPGEIHIGGTLRLADQDPDDIAAFLAACSAQPTEWGGPSQRDALTLDTLHRVVDPKTGWITFRNDEACGGAFEDLEALCPQFGLSYDRTTDAGYNHDGQLVRWRPELTFDFPEGVVEIADQHGRPLVGRGEAEDCVKLFLEGRVEEGVREADALFPPVAPLPKFEVDTRRA